MSKRKHYSPEYKRELVELVRRSQSSCRQIALEVGLSPNLLTRWVREAKGILALEQHIENPSESTLFARFPTFANNHHAVEFVCDYLRMVTLGSNNVHEMEALMDEELETHHRRMSASSTPSRPWPMERRPWASWPPCWA